MPDMPFQPISLDPAAELQRAMQRPGFAQAWPSAGRGICSAGHAAASTQPSGPHSGGSGRTHGHHQKRRLAPGSFPAQPDAFAVLRHLAQVRPCVRQAAGRHDGLKFNARRAAMQAHAHHYGCSRSSQHHAPHSHGRGRLTTPTTAATRQGPSLEGPFCRGQKCMPLPLQQLHQGHDVATMCAFKSRRFHVDC